MIATYLIAVNDGASYLLVAHVIFAGIVGAISARWVYLKQNRSARSPSEKQVGVVCIYHSANLNELYKNPATLKILEKKTGI